MNQLLSGSTCFLNVRKKLEPTMSFKKEFASTSSDITLTESLKEVTDEESDGENVFLVNCLQMRLSTVSEKELL